MNTQLEQMKQEFSTIKDVYDSYPHNPEMQAACYRELCKLTEQALTALELVSENEPNLADALNWMKQMNADSISDEMVERLR